MKKQKNETYKNKGLSGLANLGNTCFINSCMQILSHTYELNDLLNTSDVQSKIKTKLAESVMLTEWDKLRKMLWSDNCIISPKGFLQAIHQTAQSKKIDIFTSYAQNDAGEFLLFVIDCFHNALSREINITIAGQATNDTDHIAFKCYQMIQQRYSKDYSEIWNLFYGVHVSEITNSTNQQRISLTPEPFFMIDLPIPPDNKSPTLTDCLLHYCKGETIANYKEENTNEPIQVEKKIMFWSFPTILVIDLKRFNQNNFQKNQLYISFPIDELDLSSYAIGYQKKTYIYELYGVCNHSGNVLGGHYTCYVKNANGKWYHFNDTSVSEVAKPNEIVSAKAYLLFYRKKSISP